MYEKKGLPEHIILFYFFFFRPGRPELTNQELAVNAWCQKPGIRRWTIMGAYCWGHYWCKTNLTPTTFFIQSAKNAGSCLISYWDNRSIIWLHKESYIGWAQSHKPIYLLRVLKTEWKIIIITNILQIRRSWWVGSKLKWMDHLKVFIENKIKLKNYTENISSGYDRSKIHE